jgi:amino acid transporter
MPPMVATSRARNTGGFVKRIVVGRALTSYKAEHQLLPKFLALPVFSSDPLSSVAYATEEMMLVLALAGAGALKYKVPLSLGIAALLVIVITSYRQTVRAYPRGGGSYIVARENLGTIPGLVAAAAILTDYTLTVAVSVTAGTVAIVSAAPGLDVYRVEIAIGLVLFVTLANLRGVREAGTVFAIPTYGFVAIVSVTILVGFARCMSSCPVAPTAGLPILPTAAISTFLLARAFSSGATALTGVEAIADGVQAFRRPQAKNAAATLAIMGVMAVTLFLGITVLSEFLHVRITEEIASTNSVLSQVGRTVFGEGFLFYVLQVFTAAILVLAANTAFQDFPRLSSILARDRFMPSQFRNRGDRLVFSNGVVILAAFASILIWLFHAQLTHLIQLYVVGVFTAFTLSQAGMVRRWFRVRGARWRRSAVINGVGAFTTGAVLIVVTITKYAGGAKYVVWSIPVIVAFFLSVRRHYDHVGRLLSAGHLTGRIEAENRFLLLVRDLGPATLEAVGYLRSIRPERVTPLWIGGGNEFKQAAAAWNAKAPRLGDLVMLEGGSHHLVRSVRNAVRASRSGRQDFVTVVVPEVVEGGMTRYLLGRRNAVLLKAALLFEAGAVVTDIPHVPGDPIISHPDHPIEPARSVVLVPVSAVHDATVRAVVYAQSLQAAHAEALYMVMDPEEQVTLVESWHERGLSLPLVIVEAAFRDLTEPLLREVRKYTARPDTVVTVVLPELVPRHWWENFLHNQTALFVKRLLLFEPGVVLTSVPYHLRDPEVDRQEAPTSSS